MAIEIVILCMERSDFYVKMYEMKYSFSLAVQSPEFNDELVRML